MVITSPHPPASVPNDCCLTDFILTAASSHSGNTALLDPITSEKITYGDFAKNVRRFAHAIHQRGLRKNDVIMVVLPNHVMYPVVLLGSIWNGTIVSTCNSSYVAGEIQRQLELSESTYIITDSELLDKVKEAAKTVIIKELFLMGSQQVDGCILVSDLIDTGDPKFTPDVTYDVRDHVALLSFSSGTTGLPKAVMLTHYNLLAYACQITDIGLDTGSDVYVCTSPMCHMYTLGMVVLYGLARGHTIVVLPQFEFRSLLNVIGTYKVTSLHITLPVAVLLAKEPIVAQYDLTSLRSIIVAAAPLSAAIERDVMKATGVMSLRQNYGMTELCAITLSPTHGANTGSVGVPVRSVSMKVVSMEMNTEVGTGNLGEIWVKTPGITKGYVGDAESTSSAITPDGWFKTGDLGYHDEDGNFYIVDRIKEVLKCQGLQVAPAEIEAVLLTHDNIVDACVVGLPDVAMGELPMAFVVGREGCSISEQEVADFVEGQVAPHKALLGGVRFVESIPKSPSGKILRRILRDQVLLDEGDAN